MTRALAALALSACVLSCTSASSTPAPCPSGHARDPVRERAIVERLESVPLGASLSARLATTRGLCFDDAALNVVTRDRTLLVASTLPIDEAAARVGHLLVHVRDGLPMGDAIPDDADCDALVSEALDAEAVAYVTEVRLQRALGAVPHALAFEFARDLESLDDPAATALVRAYLEAHPTGAPNIDGLAAGYRARCLRER